MAFDVKLKQETVVQLNDWDLVQKCQAGDVGAFQELVARYHTKVFMVVLGILHHREDALDIAQETFFRAFRKIHSFRGGSTFYTWIYRIAVNLSIDFRRRQKRSPTELTEAIEKIAEQQKESENDPYTNLQRSQLGGRILTAINDLTPDHKAVIVLRAVEGLSYREISRILGCSEGTVMSRLHYARKKLQEKLSPYL